MSLLCLYYVYLATTKSTTTIILFVFNNILIISNKQMCIVMEITKTKLEHTTDHHWSRMVDPHTNIFSVFLIQVTECLWQCNIVLFYQLNLKLIPAYLVSTEILFILGRKIHIQSLQSENAMFFGVFYSHIAFVHKTERMLIISWFQIDQLF